MLMAVADGHGGRRYRRSEVGSRLACETALAVAAAALAAAPAGPARTPCSAASCGASMGSR